MTIPEINFYLRFQGELVHFIQLYFAITNKQHNFPFTLSISGIWIIIRSFGESNVGLWKQKLKLVCQKRLIALSETNSTWNKYWNKALICHGEQRESLNGFQELRVDDTLNLIIRHRTLTSKRAGTRQTKTLSSHT